MRRIVVETITAAAFAPFGILLEIGEGLARLNFFAPVTNLRAEARANLVLVRPPVVSLPFVVDTMERHSFSTQAFAPMFDAEALILVAPDGPDGPLVDQARAFRLPRGQGLSYHVATWHMGMALMGRAGPMAMLVHEAGDENDTTYRSIEPVTIAAA